MSRGVLALVALLSSVAGAAWMVPLSAWGDLVDPAARQGPLILLLVPVLLMLRRKGRAGVIAEKRILCVVLAAMPLVYLESGVLHGARRSFDQRLAVRLRALTARVRGRGSSPQSSASRA